jgi:hypothetical protein
MIYIIISNVGMAVMMMILYLRYSRFRLSSAAKIRELQKKFDTEFEGKRSVENQLAQINKAASDKVESLLREVDELRKEKESEIKLRFGAEKQIELALKKTEEIEKRMQDWRVVQDAVMQDSKNAIVKVGNDLYKKLSDNYKTEVETNKNLLGRVSKNISEFFDKFGEKVVGVKKDTDVKTTPHNSVHTEIHVEDPAKKLIVDLVETMKASGHLVNKNYFLPANFDEHKAKLLLCEVAFIRSEKLYLIDFKVCRYLAEFNQLKVKNQSAADDHLKQKLEKYFSYLSNPKYRESILKVMATTTAKFEKNIITIIIPTKADLQVIKEVGYYDKFKKIEFEIMDFDGVNNLVL